MELLRNRPSTAFTFILEEHLFLRQLGGKELTTELIDHILDSSGDCVEVAACPSTVHVRDSKIEDSPQLALAPASWTRFLSYAVQG